MAVSESSGTIPEAALVLPSFRSGGSERVVLNLARGLRSTGSAVRLVVLDAQGPLRTVVPEGVEVVDLARVRARRAGPALLTHLRRHPAALVIGSQTHVNVLLALLRPMLPGATRLVLREPTLHPLVARARHRERAVGRMLGRADLVVASSPAMRDHLSATVRGRARILLVPNPVDVAALRAAAAGTDVPPATSGPASARLIAVGRLIDIKAHDELLHALAESGASHTLTIVGDGPLRSHLEELAGRLGLSDRVELVGHIDDPGRLAARVAAADLLVHPSRFEGMPNAVLEALALGTPVLATTDLEVLADLANEVGPVALRLVDRERLATALVTVRPAGPDPTPRLSLLPERFHVDAVVRSLLAALSSLEERSGA